MTRVADVHQPIVIDLESGKTKEEYMKNANDFRAAACRPAGLSAIAGVLIAAAQFAVLHAAPTQYFYNGTDPYNKGTMHVTLTATAVANTYSMQGSISLPGETAYTYNIPSLTCKTLWPNQMVGAALTATACDLPPGDASYQPVEIWGTLSGTLGSASSSIQANTGWLYFGQAGLTTFQFTLAYGGSAGTSGSTGTSGTTSTGTSKPRSMHMTGATGFGYTVVVLTLDFALEQNNTAYSLSGTILVKREVLVGSKMELEETTLTVSGVLSPGVEGSLTVSGAPPGNNPEYSGTIASGYASYTSFLSGIPSLGITGLFINASI